MKNTLYMWYNDKNKLHVDYTCILCVLTMKTYKVVGMKLQGSVWLIGAQVWLASRN